MDCMANDKAGKVILVDGSNIAFNEKTDTGKPKIDNLIATCCELRGRGFRPIIIVDAALRYEIDDQGRFDDLREHGAIRQAPADADADWFVLETADRFDAKVVSNDLFRSYKHQYPWIDERRIPVMIIDGKVELYEPKPVKK